MIFVTRKMILGCSCFTVHGSSADSMQGLKAHMMAVSFCSKFRDDSQLLRTKQEHSSNPPSPLLQHRLPSGSTHCCVPHTPRTSPEWWHRTGSSSSTQSTHHSYPRRTCHVIPWLCLQASSPTLLHRHELYSSPPHSQRGW